MQDSVPYYYHPWSELESTPSFQPQLSAQNLSYPGPSLDTDAIFFGWMNNRLPHERNKTGIVLVCCSCQFSSTCPHSCAAFQTTIQLENLQPNIRYCRSCCLWKICFAYNLTISEPPAPQSNAIQPTTTQHQHRYRISEAALLGATIDCILVSGQPPPFLPLLGTHRLSAQAPTGSLGDYSGGRIQSFSKLCH